MRVSKFSSGLVATLAIAALLVGCGSGPPPPQDTVENYLNQLAARNYASACGLLDSRTRAALVRSTGRRTTCSKLFARCLPNDPQQLKRDQAQLFYGNVTVSVAGNRAEVKLGGTHVASVVRDVTLARERGVWKLTSYGQELKGCARSGRPVRA